MSRTVSDDEELRRKIKGLQCSEELKQEILNRIFPDNTEDREENYKINEFGEIRRGNNTRKGEDYFDRGKMCYEAGNYTQAYEWYRVSSEEENADAQYFLGHMFDYGYGGLTKNHTEALKFYQMAAQQNHHGAIKRLSEINDLKRET